MSDTGLCPKCGAQFPEGAVFCESCGTALGAAPGAAPAQTSPEAPQYQTPPAPPYQQPAVPQQPYQQPYQQPVAPQQPYQQPYQQPPIVPAGSGSKSLSVASMVLGIIAVVLWCFWYLAIPAAIVSLILGGVSLSRKSAGRSMAIAGVVLSIIAIGLAIIAIATAGAILSSFDWSSLQ